MEPINLVALPDEVLLCILSCLNEWERQAVLLNLSLVNRRFAAFAEVELYYSPTITPARAHLLIARILETPTLASKIARLSIQCTGAEEERLLKWEPINWDSRMTMAKSAAENSREARCRSKAILRTHGFGYHCTPWISGPTMDWAFVVDIAALVLLASNIRSLTLDYQVASDMGRPIGLHEDGTLRYASHLLSQTLPRLVQLRIRPRKLSIWLESHEPLPKLKYEILRQHFGGYEGHIDALRERVRVPYAEACKDNNGKLHAEATVVDRDDKLQLDRLNLGSMIALKYFEIPSHALTIHANNSDLSTPLAFPPNMQTLKITACAWNIVEYLDHFATTECKKYIHLQRVEAVWEDYVVRKDVPPSSETAYANTRQVITAFEEHNVDMIWTLLGGRGSQERNRP